ncbi:MAG: ribosome-associated translation inhibitor RaiA [Ruminococcaceae bacterium]|nr:ribosome-associated translation inhibitor RaiA [Oscillospiraceae bacterium]
MKMNFTARQMKVYDQVKETAEKKLAKFDKFFDDAAEMDITFSLPNGQEMVEITIRSQGMVFRAEEAADTFATAIDSATEALERQIRKNKTRLQKKIKADAFTIIDEDLNENYDEEEYVQSVRTKTFPFKPMNVEEAILQMNMLGHDFFVFKDADTLETCVVYKRKRGGYGLIIPE